MSDNHNNCEHDHEDCNCEQEMNVVTLTLEDDTEVECYILGTFDVDEKEYIALLPVGDENVLIYIYEEAEDGVELELIESDEEFEKVSKVFYTLFAEEEEDEQE